MSDFEIRKGNKGDINGIIKVLQGIGWHYAVTKTPFKDLQTRFESIFEEYEENNHDIFVALKDQIVVGFVVIHWISYLIFRGKEGYISELFVDIDFTGKGVGTLLLEHVKSKARRKGCYRLSLLNSTRKESYKRGFYTKIGWKERDWMKSFTLLLDDDS